MQTVDCYSGYFLVRGEWVGALSSDFKRHLTKLQSLQLQHCVTSTGKQVGEKNGDDQDGKTQRKMNDVREARDKEKKTRKKKRGLM